jgi:hypothetical protein
MPNTTRQQTRISKCLNMINSPFLGGGLVKRPPVCHFELVLRVSKIIDFVK